MLMLDAHPELTPDQIKFRLMYSARPAVTGEEDPVYNVLQQGMGRVWPQDAIYGELPDGQSNQGMDIQADLAHGWATEEELAYRYQGAIRKALSDDGTTYLYYAIDSEGNAWALGMAETGTMARAGTMTWAGTMAWAEALAEAGVDPSTTTVSSTIWVDAPKARAGHA